MVNLIDKNTESKDTSFKSQVSSDKLQTVKEKYKSVFSTCSGPSMYPTLRNGDGLVLEKFKSFDEIIVGDIITYPHPDPAKSFDVVHRIIKIEEEGVITRGDNNNKVDPYLVRFEDIKGKVNAVKRNNKVVNLKNGSLGYLVHRIMLFRKLLAPILKPLRWFSAVIEESKVFNFLNSLIQIEKIEVKKKGIKEVLLIYNGKVVGKKNVEKGNRWDIKFPYKYFIDKRKI